MNTNQSIPLALKELILQVNTITDEKLQVVKEAIQQLADQQQQLTHQNKLIVNLFKALESENTDIASGLLELEGSLVLSR